MKIEVGKTYRDRKGDIVTIDFWKKNKFYEGCDFWALSESMSYMEDGRFLPFWGSANDLVEEVAESKPSAVDEERNDKLRIQQLEREINEAHAEISSKQNFIECLENELDAMENEFVELSKDKARLDWILQTLERHGTYGLLEAVIGDWNRDAIDAAMESTERNNHENLN